MADKAFWWIKLRTDFFDLPTIDYLISQKNGCEYIVLYQKLCLISSNNDGDLSTVIGEMIIPYNAEKIARDTKFNLDTVVVALELFKNLGLIYVQENGALKIPAVKDMVGSETIWAEKKRQKRGTLSKTLSETLLPTLSDKSIEFRVKSLELDKDLDLERETQEKICAAPAKKRYGEFSKVLLTDEEYQKLAERLSKSSTDSYIGQLDSYIASKGVSYKSHYVTILNWARKDFEKKPKPETKSYDIDEINKYWDEVPKL